MTEAYVLETVRTPRAKASPSGGLHEVTPLALLEHLYEALQKRTALDPVTVDDIVLGCASQVGEQGANLARVSALTAGWGDHVPGVTINRFCASGLDAVNMAAARVRCDEAGLIVAGGVESVSRVPMFSDNGPLWADAAVVQQVGSVHMGIAGDLVATMEGFSRDELDAYGARTQQRAAAAWEAGRFDRSLVPVAGCERDEHVRPGTTMEQLAALEPSFAEMGAQGQDELVLSHHPELGKVEHLHTRGTSPSLADAAGVVVVGSESCGLAPRARLVASATRSVDPVIMLTAGQLAAVDAIARAGLTPDDIDLFEFAEAFAALCLRFQRDLGVDDDRFNVNGGTIAMGHAFGATGAILLTTLIDELERRGGRYGVVAISGAAGLGVATVVERVAA